MKENTILFMVRKGGLEPPWSCDRQPLKLVRLPISPLPHIRMEQGSRQPGNPKYIRYF